ncbi:mobile element protein [Rhodococcus wratislaviensis]|uniref:Mobile element protein n=1 Tax=Rhodococcus wratislaviensis TaxID=44752 RepID=A0A402CDC2_RHOWR|nr:hypothetical protein [Rhodococcus wratislaviensis]GCE41587.1 mobile element protein [Rhodococcus wratislaviensis]
MLPGIEDRAFLDVDSLLCPVYGHQKQRASYGQAKIAGRALLRKELSTLVWERSQDSPGHAGIDAGGVVS